MKLLILISFATLCVFLSISCEEPDELTIECEFYSHLEGFEKAPDSKLLAHYIDSAHTFSEDYSKYYERQKSRYENFEDSLLFEIDTVAYILNHAIVDIILEISPGARQPGDFQDEIGKMVLIETEPGLFRLLYAALTSPGVYVPERTKIKRFGSYEVIYTKSRYHGQYTLYTEDYWIHNTEDNCFKRLDYYSAIRDTVNALVPDSCSSSRSRFVIDSLFWYNYLGKEEDHYRWPTCGRIKVWFRHENCRLVPEKIIYDPDDKAPH